MEDKIKFGFYALVIIILQSILKIAGVLLTGSLSFLSETVDTLTDILFVSILLYSLYRSKKPPDYDHMYGHFKFDPIGALVQGIILMSLYVFLIINAFQSFIEQTYNVINADFGIIILIISFSINFVFSRLLISQGKKKASLVLQLQGINLFQDSMRVIIVIISLIFALFGIIFLDPIFSIILSIWIIYGAFKITKEGIKDLSDINPVSMVLIEEIRTKIFNLEHVNGVHELKIRASGRYLYLNIYLAVEDHISIVHAYEITKSIRSMAKKYFSTYEVECIIEMNPLGSERSEGEKLINLIHSILSGYPEIIDFKDLNLFTYEEKTFLSVIIILDETLSLKEAHKVSSNFELKLKTQALNLSRIITHIEGQSLTHSTPIEFIKCETTAQEKLKEITRLIEGVLRAHRQVRGYHALEFWSAGNHCILEIHVFFNGSRNISEVHKYITELEHEILMLKIEDLEEIILHSEPIEDQDEGIIF